MSATGTFNTGEVRPWDPPAVTTSKTVTFANPYPVPPTVPLGLNSLDIGRETNIRARAYGDNVTTNGFDVHVDTWEDTKLYSGGVSWLELGPANIGFQSGEFSTGQVHPWDKPQLATSYRINFATPYITPPKVICFIKALDMARDANWRLRTYVTNIDPRGFTINVDTWENSVLYSAVAGWIAYPDGSLFVYSDTVNTGQVHPWDQPQLQTSKAISFNLIPQFWRTPSAFIALNYIDISNQANLRVRSYTDNITQTGLTWHIDTWQDTTLYGAGISILCIA